MKESTKYLIISVILCIIAIIAWYFKNIVAYILIAAVVSLIGKPIVDFMGRLKIRKHELPRGLRTIITLLLILLILFSFLSIVIPVITTTAAQLSQVNSQTIYQGLQDPITAIDNYINSHKLSANESFSLMDFINSKLVGIFNFSMITNLFTKLISTLGNLFIAIFSITFIAFFFIKDEHLFRDSVLYLVPDKLHKNFISASDAVKKLLSRYFIGVIIESTSVMILVTIGLTIAGVGFTYSVMIGLISGLFNIIPYIGPLIGSTLGTLLGIAMHLNLNFYEQLLPLIIFMIIVFALVQLIDNMLLQPLIYSSTLKTHPLEVFLILLLAGTLGGVVGMIIAIPVYVVIKVFIKEFLIKLKVVKKLTKNFS